MMFTNSLVRESRMGVQTRRRAVSCFIVENYSNNGAESLSSNEFLPQRPMRISLVVMLI